MSFGQKLAFGFAAVVVLTVLIGGVAVYTLRQVVEDWERVAAVLAVDLRDTRELQIAALRRVGANRAFLLTGDEAFKRGAGEQRSTFQASLDKLKQRARTEPERRLLADIELLSEEQSELADRSMELRGTNASLPAVVQQFQGEVIPKNDELADKIKALVEFQEGILEAAQVNARNAADRAVWTLAVIAVAAMLTAAMAGWAISRWMAREIGSAVQHIQSSSSELQAAANQQTAGSKEQVASMSEISTTMKELLSTARQIADSAQRVARIAQESTDAARSGGGTLQQAQQEVDAIRKQVEVIVTHMLDLGRKSQQIGGILEIINELAEQTNILAINATIEAAGAGDHGRRFSAVADEIRKLADRVGGSTREIRGLIEEIRSAVNTTVMATESGSKAVDAGAHRFEEVSGAFGQIADLLATTTEAAREIELSTKQQSTAVEQVNIAVTNVAQAARESEASSGQVLQTVGELGTLSRDLARLVRPQESNGRA
jgi:methyl-accepting chemotaxis protein